MARGGPFSGGVALEVVRFGAMAVNGKGPGKGQVLQDCGSRRQVAYKISIRGWHGGGVAEAKEVEDCVEEHGRSGEGYER